MLLNYRYGCITLLLFISFKPSILAESPVRIFEPKWTSVPKKGDVVTLKWTSFKGNENKVVLSLYESGKELPEARRFSSEQVLLVEQ